MRHSLASLIFFLPLSTVRPGCGFLLCPLPQLTLPHARARKVITVRVGSSKRLKDHDCDDLNDITLSGAIEDPYDGEKPRVHAALLPARVRSKRAILRRVADLASPFLLASVALSRPAVAVGTGGRIGGGVGNVPEQHRSAPSETQSERQRVEPTFRTSGSRRGRGSSSIVGGSSGAKIWWGPSNDLDSAGVPSRPVRNHRFKHEYDITSERLTPADVLVVGGATAGIVALQRRNSKGGGGGGQRGVNGERAGQGVGSVGGDAVVTTLQVAFYCDRLGGRGDVLDALDSLSRTANISSQKGLATLMSDVCLALLRAEKDWVGASGGIKEYKASDGRRRNKRHEQGSLAQALAGT
ncbi:unnamed protein product, partial [Discosporangium mesarthrocarpum]